jgi:hypothetical protein
MFGKRILVAGVVVAAGTVATAGAYAYAATTSSDQDAVYLVSSLQGRNEVPGGKGRVGDPAGRAVEVLKIQGSTVSYAVRWNGIGAPTEGHIHAGGRGVNGDVKIELFDAPRPGGFAHGSVRVRDKKLLASLVADPGTFYANLHTARFPGGAVRGQFHKLSRPVSMRQPAIDLASVVQGAQVYACTGQSDGTFAFTQHNVAAVLEGNIRHSFVQPDAGPPQWVAPDGTSVTGTVVLKTPNGTGNIPELDLKATQTGAERGRFAGVAEVLRLNTVRGTAPEGSCDPQRTPTVAVPYQADYLFVG